MKEDKDQEEKNKIIDNNIVSICEPYILVLNYFNFCLQTASQKLPIPLIRIDSVLVGVLLC